jgi:hypothetical protein
MPHWYDFILMVLASFRFTRLVVYDTITNFMRAPFHNSVEETLPDGTSETYIEIKGDGIKYWIGELLSCHWCIGIWSSIIIYTNYLLFPIYAIPVITILAIAGCASIIQSYIENAKD